MKAIQKASIRERNKHEDVSSEKKERGRGGRGSSRSTPAAGQGKQDFGFDLSPMALVDTMRDLDSEYELGPPSLLDTLDVTMYLLYSICEQIRPVAKGSGSVSIADWDEISQMMDVAGLQLLQVIDQDRPLKPDEWLRIIQSQPKYRKRKPQSLEGSE
uniref:Uncharacterized protein n=1 Tax=Fibrocapsa japonica TaxID=94617 RepID=A0A7S2V4P8_9STRA